MKKNVTALFCLRPFDVSSIGRNPIQIVRVKRSIRLSLDKLQRITVSSTESDQLSYAPLELVAVEGIEPTSLDYQSSALAVELHREIG